MAKQKGYEERYVTTQDGLRLYYRDYNPTASNKTPLLCLHGLTRNSSDFHDLACHFSAERRIISPDMRGRGRSDYDPNYMNYQIPTYVNDVMHLLAAANVHQVISVGTSMGGLITMGLAAARPALLKGVVLNDIGPEINPEGIARISGYVGKTATLRSWPAAVNILKTLNEPFFPDYDAADWMKFARNTFVEKEDGSIVANYDMKIGTAIKESDTAAVPADLWPLFEGLGALPTLVLRGEKSDILSAETLSAMAERHPMMTAVTISLRGHAPDLGEPESLVALRTFVDQVDG
ncbi:alpha/beta fold hydrolase [Luteithermobacter gelatinilyticus]|uniref:alpha/beta fold hydrolase n=1 Tax=Luteithermobacter gelatinilyticus TaxID=2582913 RepID=UPI001106BDF7|nr:alpha/beta hydrolase [Luteithermobacter gelatinilyticus]